MRKKYKTIEEFCTDNGLRYPIPVYMQELNACWIRNGNDPKRLRKHLLNAWREDDDDFGFRCTIKGVCEWIVNLVMPATKIPPPLPSDDDTVLIIKSEARDELLKILQDTYQELILANVCVSSNHYVKALVAKMKLIWALLGFYTDDVNTWYCLETHEPKDMIIEARLLPLFKAQARSKGRKTKPDHLIEMDPPQIKLLTEQNQRGE